MNEKIGNLNWEIEAIAQDELNIRGKMNDAKVSVFEARSKEIIQYDESIGKKY